MTLEVNDGIVASEGVPDPPVNDAVRQPLGPVTQGRMRRGLPHAPGSDPAYDQHEDAKPKHEGGDRHEPQAEVDQGRVPTRDLRVLRSAEQDQGDNGKHQSGPCMFDPDDPRAQAA